MHPNKMSNEPKNIILDKTIEFSLAIIEYVELLEKNKKYVIANQLIKSGTSIGANVHEAQNAESKNDFIHKFKIAAKEIEETDYWLTLCEKSSSYPKNTNLQIQLIDIKRIVTRIIATSKTKENLLRKPCSKN